MSDIISLDPDIMDALVRAHNNLSQELEGIAADYDSMANNLEEGVLLGRGGAALAEGMREISPGIRTLMNAITQLAHSIQVTKDEFLDMDQSIRF